MKLLYRVKINDAITVDAVGDDTVKLKKNGWCIIRCPRYEDYGRVMNIGPWPEGMADTETATIKRQATLVDQGKANENNVRSKSHTRKCQEQIEAHELPMSLVSTHVTFDRSLVIFVFTAPGRVDFRALLKDLTKALGSRVELRQIGPRDEAGTIGGMGSCGRQLCCSAHLTSFVSINVKMAKSQGISLNPSNIIGACGRLKCCLSYEAEGYRQLMSTMPKNGSRCECDGCEGKIIDCNALTQTVKVLLANNRQVSVPVSEVRVAGK